MRERDTSLVRVVEHWTRVQGNSYPAVALLVRLIRRGRGRQGRSPARQGVKE